MLNLSLYHRPNCHLCEEMQTAVTHLQQQYNFSVQLINIDTDELLRLRYNDKIPVLTYGEQEICRYHLKEAELFSLLKQHN